MAPSEAFQKSNARRGIQNELDQRDRIELQQNTRAIEVQTRDSITEKQIGVSRDAADVFQRGNDLGMATLDPVELQMYIFLANGFLREWENSHFQYE